MAKKYPQPPGDAGSRGNLVDRKGKVERVEKGFVGIVNVYSLIPKGGGAVKVESFNIPPAPEGAKIYPQSKPPKGSPPSGNMQPLVTVSKAQMKKAEKDRQRLIDLKTNATTETFKLEKDSHQDVNRLKKYIGGQSAGWVKDIGVYEQWLKDNKSMNNQFGYTLDTSSIKTEAEKKRNQKLFSALRELRKRANTKDFEPILNRQAMNLSVSRDRLLQWYNASSMNLDKATNTVNKQQRTIEADKLAREKLEEARVLPDIINIDNIVAKKPAPKLLSVSDPTQLPVPLNRLQRKNYMEVNNINKYLPLTPEQIEGAYKADPTHVVYTQDNQGHISYYADVSNLSLERKRKHIRANMKRSKYMFIVKKKPTKTKRMKTSTMKKKILKRIRCKCRRK